MLLLEVECHKQDFVSGKQITWLVPEAGALAGCTHENTKGALKSLVLPVQLLVNVIWERCNVYIKSLLNLHHHENWQYQFREY